MGVVTSSHRDHFDIIHSQTDLLPFFDFVLTSDHVSMTKPDPELYLKGMKLAKCSPDRCIVVEDSARGLLAAYAAENPCYVIPTEWAASSDLSLAAGILNSVTELKDILLPKKR
jgi:HAD superfamily hydrolase (TIGR01509 family)